MEASGIYPNNETITLLINQYGADSGIFYITLILVSVFVRECSASEMIDSLLCEKPIQTTSVNSEKLMVD